MCCVCMCVCVLGAYVLGAYGIRLCLYVMIFMLARAFQLVSYRFSLYPIPNAMDLDFGKHSEGRSVAIHTQLTQHSTHSHKIVF